VDNDRDSILLTNLGGEYEVMTSPLRPSWFAQRPLIRISSPRGTSSRRQIIAMWLNLGRSDTLTWAMLTHATLAHFHGNNSILYDSKLAACVEADRLE
jgi:hypothetical protein